MEVRAEPLGESALSFPLKDYSDRLHYILNLNVRNFVFAHSLISCQGWSKALTLDDMEDFWLFYISDAFCSMA